MASLASASSLSRASSVSRSGCLENTMASIASTPRLPPHQSMHSRRPQRRVVKVRAEMQPKGVVAELQRSCSKFLRRYDPVTTGIGSLLVTGYCVVVHQQSVGEALNIAACATVLGMVMQEVFFNNDDDAKNQA